MKATFITISIFLLIAGTYWGVDNFLLSRVKPVDPLSSSGSEPTFKTAPDFSIKDIHDQPLTISQFRGKVVIVNFWASWCAPCVEEFPSLIKLINAFPDDAVLIAISADKNSGDITNFLKNYEIDKAPIYIAQDEDGDIASLYGTKKLPESYIFTKDGSFHKKVSGYKNWNSPTFIQTLHTLTKY